MRWLTGIVVYFVLWWLALFAVLSVKVTIPKSVPPGHATSAPEDPRLGLKALLAAGIAAVLWMIYYAVVVWDVLSLRDAP